MAELAPRGAFLSSYHLSLLPQIIRHSARWVSLIGRAEAAALLPLTDSEGENIRPRWQLATVTVADIIPQTAKFIQRRCNQINIPDSGPWSGDNNKYAIIFSVILFSMNKNDTFLEHKYINFNLRKYKMKPCTIYVQTFCTRRCVYHWIS